MTYVGYALRWARCLGVLLAAALVAPAEACSIACATAFASGPRSWLEFVIVMMVAVTVAAVFVQAIRYTIRPGEETPGHIKQRILQEDQERP